MTQNAVDNNQKNRSQNDAVKGNSKKNSLSSYSDSNRIVDSKSSLNSKNSMPTENIQPPAVKVNLTGQYLIEASAGTGKTWTLTGILLRLLIEARRAPEQIIATTFTRAAAAEMRQRVHERLVNFYQLLKWLDTLRANPQNIDILYPHALQIIPETSEATRRGSSENNRDSSSKYKTFSKAELETMRNNRENWLIEQAELSRFDTLIQDPINLHLIIYLLNREHSYPLTEALRRTALVLTTLDKLFIGTLDSLAQKWLAEYSSETGHQQGMAIIEDTQIKHVTQNIAHDELRQFQSQLYHEQPQVYDLLEQQGKLTAIKDHLSSVDKALNFISAEIDTVQSAQPFDFEEYEQLLQTFAVLDLSDIAPYFDKDYRKAQGFGARASINTRFHKVLEIHDVLKQHRTLNFKALLSEDAIKLFEALKAAQLPNDKGRFTGFNTKHESQHEEFFELETIKALMAIYDATQALDDYLTGILAQLNRHIAISVRQKLPIILEERGETTFTLQMVRLNQALTGHQGQKLARYIRHHYPVALIDESQDIDGEQALMIEQVYLAKKSPNQPDSLTGRVDENKRFLLLVGDPKQAIYGFRGGDVANYNSMKQRFNSNAIMTLNKNRRSNVYLIDALNHWFGMPEPLSTSNKLSELGDSIHYQSITAVKQTASLSWLNAQSLKDAQATNQDILPDKAVSLIHLPYDKDTKYDDYETTALHIKALLNSGHSIEAKPIQPSDIAVLGKAKKDLKHVEDMLRKLNVPTLATSEISIFETQMATDIAALMAAMLHPYRRDMINRVLISRLFGLSLTQVKSMMVSHDTGVAESDDIAILNDMARQAVNSVQHIKNSQQTKSYQDFITLLKQGAIKWQNWGILSTLNFLLDKNSVHPQGVWQTLASQADGERHIMDLRHIMDILAQYGMGSGKSMGEHELLAWFQQNMNTASTSEWAKQQPLPTESGVQLMTIHKSKGLEFPVVYVLGMDKSSKKAGDKEKFGMYLYNAKQQQDLSNKVSSTLNNTVQSQRRLSPVKGTLNDADYYTNQVTQENLAELKRLGYVAFTRASEQLFIVINDAYDKTGFNYKPMVTWLDSTDKTFALPDRLQSNVGFIRGINVIENVIENVTKNDVTFAEDEHVTLNSPDQKLSHQRDSNLKISNDSIKIDYPSFDDIIPKTYFYGWSKTSFTALARQLDDASQAVAVIDERIDDDIIIDTSYRVPDPSSHDSNILSADTNVADKENMFTNLKAETDIRFSFVRGANAGTFLHEVFEKIDFDENADSSHWSAVIDRAISTYQLPLIYSSANHQARMLQTTMSNTSNLQDININDSINNSIDDSHHQSLKNWIYEVMQTPLLASEQPLNTIAANKRFAELGFNMGLSEDFKPQAINDLFKTHLPDDPDKHIVLNPQEGDYLYRYLRGEIDLVYEHAGKFYVVDYKSNHLGNSLTSYDETTLKTAMNKAGYWLQAAIYQVALHRFLSMRISDYEGNEAKYLGAVEYVFLRGTYDTATPGQHLCADTNTRFGLVTWDIPINFVKALDALFGKPQ